ncbi:hypothetical protein Nepgr_030335 [Nepenthes gracilis]|uniref:Uncharacterized protein n=1 Tax=Nepenthes gracilis TaxID=150966 RepID=A0AAD3TFK6_NEPGR|nr:hypothetical protein Nepgr_030335 [Nepenthes gracilis]
MKRQRQWDEQVDLISSDDSSSNSDVEAPGGIHSSVNHSVAKASFPQQSITEVAFLMGNDGTNRPTEVIISEEGLVRRARMYQEYMKQIPIPSQRGSVIPCNSWMGLAKSIKQLYGQPLHYLTNKLLREWDRARFETDDQHRPLDSIFHPVKAEANIWLIEEVHRLTASHDHIAKLWLHDERYHALAFVFFLASAKSQRFTLSSAPASLHLKRVRKDTRTNEKLQEVRTKMEINKKRKIGKEVEYDRWRDKPQYVENSVDTNTELIKTVEDGRWTPSQAMLDDIGEVQRTSITNHNL